MRNKTKAPPKYEQIYRCLIRRGLVVGKEIKANDAHCARVAAEDLKIPVKPSHVRYMRQEYGLSNPHKPPTYQEIDEAINSILTNADIKLQKHDIYRASWTKNGRKKSDVYFGDEVKDAPAAATIKVICSQSFISLEVNDKQMAEMVSEIIGKPVKIKQITYWRRQNGVEAGHANHGGKREYSKSLQNQEDTTAMMENNHRWDTYRLSRDQGRTSYTPIGEETVSFAQAVQSM